MLCFIKLLDVWVLESHYWPVNSLIWVCNVIIISAWTALDPAVCGALYLFIGVQVTGHVCGRAEQVGHQSITRIVQIMRICNIQLYIWVRNKYFFQRSNLVGSLSWYRADPAPDDVTWKRKWLQCTICDISPPNINFHNKCGNVLKVAGTNPPSCFRPWTLKW